MLVKRGYRVELELNNVQITACRKHAGAARFAYNYALTRKKENYTAGFKTPYAAELYREINLLKKDNLWMYEVSKCAFQEGLRDADSAFDHFYRKCKLKKEGKCGSRKHSRKKKGSNNRRKAKQKLACVHVHIANVRKDALHKATTAIVARTKPDCDRPAVIVLEDLNISGMLKNHKLARACADVGLFEFKRQVLYKRCITGVEVKLASRWYPSSKTCHACGWVKQDLTLSNRVFVCEDCGNVTDRDYNAACNLASLA